MTNPDDNLTLLGQSLTKYPSNPEEANLELINNQFLNHDYLIELECFEFTCLCPKTSQPDFGKIIIKYIPNKFLIESKALKLYLFSFRNIGVFHEFVINRIANDLNSTLQAKYLMVQGKFQARGGISIMPLVQLGDIELYKQLS